MLAAGSVSGSSTLTVFSFASILAMAAIGQTLVIQQGGLDLTVPGVISLAAVLVTKYPAGDNSARLPGRCRHCVRRPLRPDLRNRHYALSRHGAGRDARSQCAALWHGAVSHQGYVDRGSAADASGFAVGRIYGIPFLAIFALVPILLIEIGIRATVLGRRFVAVGVNARAARAAGCG